MTPRTRQSVIADWVYEKVDTGSKKHSDTMVSMSPDQREGGHRVRGAQ